MTAGVGRDEGVGEGGREGLGLVVARGADELGAADDRAVEAGNEDFAAGNEKEAAEVVFQGQAAGGLEPTEAAAVEDGGVGGLADLVEVVVIPGRGAGDFYGVRDLIFEGTHYGDQRRKLARMRRPMVWLFST